MTVEDLSPEIVRKFLDHLERDRQCSGVTRNQRLATIHSLARFIGMRSPVHLAWCAEIRAVPFKKTAKSVIGYLEKAEMDALLNQPDRRTSLGVRDHALLLFLYNSGARADEAAKLTIGDLQLGASASVRLHGKGNKVRICPLWPKMVTSLSSLVTERDRNDAVFLSRVNQPLTRFQKIIDPALIAKSSLKNQLKRASREKDLVDHGHPRLFEVFDVGKCDVTDNLFVAMGLLEPITLGHSLKKVPRDRIAPIISQIASTALFLEQRGMVHRDIKPENIIISSDCSASKEVTDVKPLQIGFPDAVHHAGACQLQTL